MTTIGYGDIVPSNMYEALFVTINMIVMSCCFAYSINNIGSILKEIEKEQEQLNNNIITIQRYLDRKNTNFELKSRVRNYLYFLSSEQKNRDQNEEEKVLNKISNKLRDEITLEINSKILSNQKIISQMFSQKTLNKIIYAMKEVLISPNEIIFKNDEVDDQSIYFIESGIVEIFYLQINKSKSIIHQLGKNQMFGELSFFSGLARKASARSVNLSTLYKISRRDFIDIIKDNQEDFEKFQMIKEKIIFQQNYQPITTNCYFCNSRSHLAQNCYKLHYSFDKQFIILKNNYYESQTRLKQVKRRNKFLKKAMQLIYYLYSKKKIQKLLKQKLEFQHTIINLFVQNLNSYTVIKIYKNSQKIIILNFLILLLILPNHKIKYQIKIMRAKLKITRKVINIIMNIVV
ncbi:hypothetical protein IMG5_173720 [Ichthyophthirius multifiliis]|uniref:Cyclic nucleotide-binding domain-containing protein n=1 Tax=Ichthyophthirius multifiliis TaxID=5932 RepID=G0R1Z1_ICHMU|nr:hypothetical protein IMG5_173720 [Ichthyophthirius multifiliis]EGR28516.1 hypothetical protein IMG5_173720 [Ichthyophthirius multifiliis]|eukprot:XP_004029752.1 hypothetical protein IMG5_173720 [Ichthyophthirius multifiliis]